MAQIVKPSLLVTFIFIATGTASPSNVVFLSPKPCQRIRPSSVVALDVNIGDGPSADIIRSQLTNIQVCYGADDNIRCNPIVGSNDLGSIEIDMSLTNFTEFRVWLQPITEPFILGGVLDLGPDVNLAIGEIDAVYAWNSPEVAVSRLSALLLKKSSQRVHAQRQFHLGSAMLEVLRTQGDGHQQIRAKDLAEVAINIGAASLFGIEGVELALTELRVFAEGMVCNFDSSQIQKGT
jgi:hypothetical protein